MTIGFLALTALAVVAAGLIYTFDPARTLGYPFCLLHRVTGLNCPGCGMLRALHHLAHGRICTAFGYNPLLVLGLFAGAPLLWWYRTRPMPPALPWLVLAVFLVYGVARNLPWWPFTMLAP
jgi:hypothetical protein